MTSRMPAARATESSQSPNLVVVAIRVVWRDDVMAEKKKMGLFKRLFVFGGLGLIGLLVVVFAGLHLAASSALAETRELEVEPINIPVGDKAALERGKYLVDHVMSCGHSDCHRSDFGGGAVMDAFPIGRVYAPNVTTGEGSVIKDYDSRDWVRAIRHGLKKDGTRALVMPSEDYWAFPDEDIGAAIAYILSQPQVNRENLGHLLGPIGKLIAATEPVWAFEKIKWGVSP